MDLHHVGALCDLGHSTLNSHNNLEPTNNLIIIINVGHVNFQPTSKLEYYCGAIVTGFVEKECGWIISYTMLLLLMWTD